MTNNQRKILNWFGETRTGAQLFEGRWVWPQTIREDAQLADRFYIRFVLESA